MTIKNVDDTYKAELNFVDEFDLNRHGMILEIEQEFNIIMIQRRKPRPVARTSEG